MGVRDLFIPRKTNGKAPQPDYGTDMRAIEVWAKEAAAAINGLGPGGLYASLTGPGETNPTGALTQTGDFNVNGGKLTQGGNDVSLGNGFITYSISTHNGGFGNGVTGIFSATPNGATIETQRNGCPITIECLDPAGGVPSGDIGINTAGGSIYINAGSSASGSHGSLNLNGGSLGFFGHTPAAQQFAGATLADLVTALRAYGLVS